MPSVLITRPHAMSEALAVTLRGLGYETAIEPLLSIAALASPRPFIDPVDAVMITSANALYALAQKQPHIPALLAPPCFCVGLRTAEKARAFGFRDVHSAEGDGRDLAQLMNLALQGKAASILHIAGRDTEGAARQALADRGHRVIEWPVYEAAPATAFTPGTRALLAAGKLDAVLVFSKRTARVLSACVTETALEACCGGLAAICLSEAVAVGLSSLPWRRLIVSPRPTEEDLIACLQEVCPVKP